MTFMPVSHAVAALDAPTRLSDLHAAGLSTRPDKGVYVGDVTWEHDKCVQSAPAFRRGHAIGVGLHGAALAERALQTWPGSALVYTSDLRLVVAAAAHRRAAFGQRVVVFDPSDAAPTRIGSRYNPLVECRDKALHAEWDAQFISEMLMDAGGLPVGERQRPWMTAAGQFLTALVLHVVAASKQTPDVSRTLSEVAWTFPADATDDALRSRLFQMRDSGYYKSGDKDSVVARQAACMLAATPAERKAIVRTLAERIFATYASQGVASATAESDWRIDDLMRGDEPMTAFLVAREPYTPALKPLMRLMIQQIERKLTADLSFDDDGHAVHGNKHRLMLMLDNFASLGRMQRFKHALAYMSGWLVESYLLVNDIDELDVYGGKRKILKRMATQVRCHDDAQTADGGRFATIKPAADDAKAIPAMLPVRNAGRRPC